MKDIKIKDSLLRVSSQRGFDAFVQVFVDAINKSIDGNLTPDSMHHSQPTRLLFSDGIFYEMKC